MNIVVEVISSVFIIVGVVFMLISAIGIVRLPDFYIRMSAITKAATMGLGLIVVGIGIYFNDITISGKVIAIIFFILITSPVSAHIIARAACMDKVPFWKGTILKEFKDYLSRFEEKNEPGQSDHPQKP
jgi:multicomponent Na+:H+ antiporter subunit G